MLNEHAEIQCRMAAGAEYDLEALHSYVGRTRSLDLADALLDQIDDVIETFETFPERGAYPSELIDGGSKRIRQLIRLPHRIIYEIVETNVEISAVVDGRRDMRSLLQKRLMQG